MPNIDEVMEQMQVALSGLNYIKEGMDCTSAEHELNLINQTIESMQDAINAFDRLGYFD